MNINPGGSLVSGIQDISAFLPIIGTEQCEKHIGEALNGGFLYAAATPLSLFGSLGIVKAGAALLCASVSPRLAQMLSDAGFNLQGSVAPLIGRAPLATRPGGLQFNGTKKKEENLKDDGNDDVKYSAAQRFFELLEDQHIDKSQVTLKFDYFGWNFGLCICTASLACLSITPYVRIIMQDHEPSPPTWTYPLMRIVGSAVSVVVAQMIIQVRMQQILRNALQSTPQPQETEAGDGWQPPTDPEKKDSWTHSPPLLRVRLFFRTMLNGTPVVSGAYDEENGDDVSSSFPKALFSDQDDSWTYCPLLLRLLQFLLFFSITSTAVGYLGCFTVVQRASPTNTYIWLGVEIGLAVLRIYIWGSNPQWDENTFLNLELQLAQSPPTITADQNYGERIVVDTTRDPVCEPFVILEDSRFLDYIAPYTGALERFSDPDHRVAIYYTLAGGVKLQREDVHSNDGEKVLLTTVLDLEYRDTYVLVHPCPPSPPVETIVYSAAIERVREMGLTMAKYDTMLDVKREFTQSRRFRDIDEHSRAIAQRIGGIGRISGVPLSWGLNFEDAAPRTTPQDPHHGGALTDIDREYLQSQGPVRIWRDVFYHEKQLEILETHAAVLDCIRPVHHGKTCILDNVDFVKFFVAMELLLVEESASFEKLLLKKTALPWGEKSDHPFYQSVRSLATRRACDSRIEATMKRIAKYEEGRKSGNNPDDPDDPIILQTVRRLKDTLAETRHIDDDTLSKFRDNYPSPHAEFNDPRVAEIWRQAKEQMEDRIAMWKRHETLEIGLAEAIFAVYPQCWDDPKLFEIMTNRGCTVLDFSGSSLQNPPAHLATTRNGVSLLGCPFRWLPALTELARTNPNILAIQADAQIWSGSAVDLLDDWERELRPTLYENRHHLAADTAFCFPAGSKVTEGAIFVAFGSPCLLVVKTAQAQSFRVSIGHRRELRPGQKIARSSWRLVNDRVPIPEQRGSIMVESADKTHSDFAYLNFTVQVPSDGVHQIVITFHTDAHLRSVGVSPLDADMSDDQKTQAENHGPGGISTFPIAPGVAADSDVDIPDGWESSDGVGTVESKSMLWSQDTTVPGYHRMARPGAYMISELEAPAHGEGSGHSVIATTSSYLRPTSTAPQTLRDRRGFTLSLVLPPVAGRGCEPSRDPSISPLDIDTADGWDFFDDVTTSSKVDPTWSQETTIMARPPPYTTRETYAERTSTTTPSGDEGLRAVVPTTSSHPLQPSSPPTQSSQRTLRERRGFALRLSIALPQHQETAHGCEPNKDSTGMPSAANPDAGPGSSTAVDRTEHKYR